MRKVICVAAFGAWLDNEGKNDIGGKWRNLVPMIHSKGYELLPIALHRRGIPVLVFDATTNILKDLKSKRIHRKDCTLVRVEPRVVNPMQYQKTMNKSFNRSFSPTQEQRTLPYDEIWQSGYLEKSRIILENAPSKLDSRPYQFGLINQNKYSCVRGELYDLRRKTIKEFDEQGLKLVVAGTDWQRGSAWVTIRYLHAALIALRAKAWPVVHVQRSLRKVHAVRFLGRVDSESAFLEQCEVAVVIENESTYSSEKLLNALIAGCRIVYVGPSLNLENFPKNQILQVDGKSEAIIRGAEVMLQRSINPSDYQVWLKDGTYLKSVEVEAKLEMLIEQLLT